MIKYALFGTGADELRALREIGNKKLAFFDNNETGEIDEIDVYNLNARL